MQLLFNFLGSVLFVTIRVFFYLRTNDSQVIEVAEIIANALAIFVLFKLLIWTIRKGKGWLVLSFATGLFFWLWLGAGVNLSENFSGLSNLLQMVAFISINNFADSLFKRSSSPAIILIIFALIVFCYGYNLFASGNLVNSSDTSTTGYPQ